MNTAEMELSFGTNVTSAQPPALPTCNNSQLEHTSDPSQVTYHQQQNNHHQQELIFLEGRKSEVWRYFGFYRSERVDSQTGEFGIDKERAICRLCRRGVAYSTASSSTSSLVAHLHQTHGITIQQPSGDAPLVLCDPPSHLQDEVWKYFGFCAANPEAAAPSAEGGANTTTTATTTGTDVDYANAVCKTCFMKLRYNPDNIYNLRRHCQLYHDVILSRKKVERPAIDDDDEQPPIDPDVTLVDAHTIRKPRSALYGPAYDHFGFVLKTDGSGELDESKVVCKLCLHEYSHTGRYHADYYLDHLKKKHSYVPGVTDGRQLAQQHNPTVADLPGQPVFKSRVWQYFGFLPLSNGEGDRTKAVCRLCRQPVDYVASGVSVLFRHVQRHGIDLKKQVAPKRKYPEDVGIFVEAAETRSAIARRSYHSPEWKYFGFYAYPLEDGQNTEIDKSKSVCRLCNIKLSFSGHVGSMSMHLHEVHDILVHEAGKYSCCHRVDAALKQDPTAQLINTGYNNVKTKSTSKRPRFNKHSPTGAYNITNGLQSNMLNEILLQTDDDSLVDMRSITKLKNLSKVWDYFGFMRTTDGVVDRTQVKCRICGTHLLYSSSTSNLNKHLRLKHGVYAQSRKPFYCETAQEQKAKEQEVADRQAAAAGN